MTNVIRVPTAADVLNYARTQLGTTETPLGSNNVVYNTWYYGRRVSGASYPWCATFLSYVADRAGAIAAGIIPRHAYTPSGAAWFQNAGRWNKTPQVGAIVYYQWPGMDRVSHVGVVETVFADGSWIAIEGNTDVAGGRTGGQVMRQHRSKVGALGGFGHPAYAASAPPPSVPAGEPPYSAVSVATQKALNFVGNEVDGRWGDQTERGVNTVRSAINGSFPYGVVEAQTRVGASTDGAWGDQSRAALRATVAELQRAWGAGVDGLWGPNTEARWKACRAAYYRT